MHVVVRYGVEFSYAAGLWADNQELRIYRGNGSRGYPVASVSKRIVNVHNIVCEIFHGPRPSQTHVCHHIDGNRFNWNPYNLAWVTQSENCRAAISRCRQLGLRKYAIEYELDYELDFDGMSAVQKKDVMRFGRRAVREENRQHMIDFCDRVGSRLPHNF